VPRELLDHVRVGAETDGRRVPGLLGDLDDRAALRDQERVERVAEIVGP